MDTRNRDILVKEWIRKASHDLGIADSLLQNNSPYTDGICFHCQQAVEKYLKAVLISHSLEFKNSHDLAYLADVLSEKHDIPDETYDKLESLQSYAVDVRYPEIMQDPSAEDARDAFAVAETLRDFLVLFVRSAGSEGQ